MKAFLLKNQEINPIRTKNRDGYKINPKGYKAQENLFDSLRLAITIAKTENYEMILCICDINYPLSMESSHLSQISKEAYEKGIFSLYVDAESEESFSINDRFKVVCGISHVASFLLSRPIYKLAIALLDLNVDGFQFSWSEFLEYLCRNSVSIQHKRILPIKQNRLHILSPFRNIENYIDEFLDSITNQNYPNYKITMIDDCSSDKSNISILKHQDIDLHINTERKWALENIVDILMSDKFQDDDIICLVDADDLLPHCFTLDIVNRAYGDKNVLMTYGSMLYYGNVIKQSLKYSQKEFNKIRESDWKFTHLRTFKYKLFKIYCSLDPQLTHLRNENGNFYRLPYDMALFFPMLEIAGYSKVKHIDVPTYIYRTHEGNDHVLSREEQFNSEILIRQKQPLRKAEF